MAKKAVSNIVEFMKDPNDDSLKHFVKCVLCGKLHNSGTGFTFSLFQDGKWSNTRVYSARCKDCKIAQLICVYCHERIPITLIRTRHHPTVVKEWAAMFTKNNIKFTCYYDDKESTDTYERYTWFDFYFDIDMGIPFFPSHKFSESMWYQRDLIRYRFIPCSRCDVDKKCKHEPDDKKAGSSRCKECFKHLVQDPNWKPTYL